MEVALPFHPNSQSPQFQQIPQGDAMFDQNSELSLEQQFNLRSFETQVQQMDREQAQEFLVKLYEQMLSRENMYKEVLKHQWGL